MPRLRLLLPVAIVAVVYLFRLDQPLLWSDEAGTGIGARNVLRVGYPVAYDDRNVTVYENGSSVNRNLVFIKIPWIQYYVGAASLVLFGDTTAGLRVLFAMIGVLTFFPIFSVLKRRVKSPELVTALVMLAPQTVLFERNARYYSILTFLYALLVWHLDRDFKSAKTRFATAAVILSLLFHTHPIAAACTCLSLVVFCAIFRRELLLPYAAAAAVASALWLTWYALLGPALAETPLTLSLIATDFGHWLSLFASGLWATVADMDAVNCLPILLGVALLALTLVRGRQKMLQIFPKSLPQFVLVNILVQSVAVSAILAPETEAHFALLRYMPHLLLFGLVCCFIALDWAIPHSVPYVLACAALVAFNPLSLTYWIQPTDRAVPLSWAAPVYAEVFHPPEEAWNVIIDKWRRECPRRRQRDIRLMGAPAWTDEVLTFYLGDLYLVPPLLETSDGKCDQAIRAATSDPSYQRLKGSPDWILDFLGCIESLPDEYVVAMEVPSHVVRADDCSRPELTRHCFHQQDVVSKVRCYVRKAN